MKIVSRKSGFTLGELMIVVVVVAILAALALPNYLKAVEITKARTAIAALEQIGNGERIYLGRNNSYWPTGRDESNVNVINTQLGTFLNTQDPDWRYTVRAWQAGPNNSFQAAAERKGKKGKGYAGGKIQLDQNGGLKFFHPLKELENAIR